MPQPDKTAVNLSKVLENDASWVYSNRVRSLMSEYIELKELQAKKNQMKMQSYKENVEDKARVFIKYDLNSKTYHSTIHKCVTKAKQEPQQKEVKTILRAPSISIYAKGISGLPTRINITTTP